MCDIVDNGGLASRIWRSGSSSREARRSMTEVVEMQLPIAPRGCRSLLVARCLRVGLAVALGLWAGGL